jgi:hypothetical protein
MPAPQKMRKTKDSVPAGLWQRVKMRGNEIDTTLGQPFTSGSHGTDRLASIRTVQAPPRFVKNQNNPRSSIASDPPEVSG